MTIEDIFLCHTKKNQEKSSLIGRRNSMLLLSN